MLNEAERPRAFPVAGPNALEPFNSSDPLSFSVALPSVSGFLALVASTRARPLQSLPASVEQ